MARRRNKKGQFSRKGGKRKKRRKSSKRRAAARRMRRDSKGHFVSKKGRRRGKKKSRGSKRRHSSIIGVKARHRARSQAALGRRQAAALHRSVAAQYKARGYSPKQASRLASRYVRKLKHAAGRAAAGPTVAERVAAAMAEANRRGSYVN